MDGHAVVIGASMAGLGAAKVLADRYERVTVLDRDELPAEAVPRRGVPQGAHAHALLVSGLQTLSRLFPGLPEQLLAEGGSRFDTGAGLALYRYGRRWPAAPTGLEMVSISRPKLETVVRARVVAEPRITVRDRVAVTGLTGDRDGVTGVTLDTGETLTAGLVVDASGRGSRSDRWLGGLGFPAPEPVEIKVGVAYSTRLYRRRPGDLPGWSAAFILPTAPHETRAALAVPIEGDRWLVGLGGWHLNAPPADAASFEAFVRDMPDPLVAGVLDRAEPLTEPLVHRFPSSRRRRFERLDRRPAGYVAIGDAICSFNPIYGQGMTCAAQEAEALGTALDRHGSASAAMARDYYRAAAEVIVTPWRFAVGGDFGYPQTTGPRPRGVRLNNWYARRIALASQVDTGINAVFQSVQHLVTPPSVLMRPRFAIRVMRAARRRLSAARR
jgi:2-polyprenyl-6-methoxyphenol hydroxylase-like FAD-dependent oxidoreductase